jgi:glucose-1-phosphate cytidylyltransferase
LKVIILAGGWGSRLGKLTERIPKPMVKIGRKPILWHIMKIYSYWGFNQFIICLGVKGDTIKDYFFNYDIRNNDFTINLYNKEIEYHKKGCEKDWIISLIDTGLNTLKGGRIKRIEKYLDPETNMLTYGDGVANINLEELVKYHKSHGKIMTITGVHAPARFGEICEKDGKIKYFREKPQISSGLINGGFMIFSNEFLNYLTSEEKCDLEIGPLEELAKEEELMVYKHKGRWACMDHERDYEYLNQLWKNNRAFWKIWD